MKLDDLEIQIERTDRRKTVSIFIERDGSVKALVPRHEEDGRIEEAVRSKQYQIFSKLAKWKELNGGRVTREFVNGQSFLYFGRHYRLSIVEEADSMLAYKGNRFLLRKDGVATADRHFKDFYRSKASDKIAERLHYIQTKFAPKPTAVKVMELGHRWASCSAGGNLNFHWKCAMAPVAVIDYIITHEMVHLTHINHSPEFWDELDKKMPNYREYESWLRNNGVKLDI